MGIPKKRKKHRMRNWYLGIVIGLVFLFGISGWYLWNKNENNKGAQETVSVYEDTNVVTYKGKRYVYNDHLSHYLFLGIDKEKLTGTNQGSGQAGQADTIFLLSRDRVQKTLFLLAIPRDTMAEIEVYGPEGKSLGKTIDHINLAYGFGDGGRESCVLMKEAVSNLLYGLPIQGYCSLTMEAMGVLADSVGGVTVTMPDDSLKEIDPTWIKGSQINLTGETIERFLRSRDVEENQSALGRLQRQQVFLEAYGEKAMEIYKKNPSLPVQLYDNIEPYMVTNIGKDQFIQMMTDFSSNHNLESRMLPGTVQMGTTYEEYHVDENALYELILEQFYVEKKEG